MSKYTLTIEGDFEKGECGKCPLGEKTQRGHNPCLHLKSGFLFIGNCPLEEATVEKNATVEGEWINIGHNGTFKCSICGKHASKSKFCPNCGAKLKGGA